MSRLQRIDDVTKVELMHGIPPFIKKRRRRGRMGVGLKYEAKVQTYFADTFGYEYIPGPWFRYEVRERPKVVNYAQPDGLLIQPKRGTVTIIEIKYNHCAESYFQLVDKYLPLARAFFGTDLWNFPLCTVVKWYDKSTSYPAGIRLRDGIDHCELSEIGVHICRPDRSK